MQNMNIDLHIHSSFSDGAYTPFELVALAKELDIHVIAIADHDSVAGVGEAVVVAVLAGVRVTEATGVAVLVAVGMT